MPYLANTANALTFYLMMITCFLNSVVFRYVGIRKALILGTMGFVIGLIYAAGVYTNNRYGNRWFTSLRVACCGTSGLIFWISEAALSPEFLLAIPLIYQKSVPIWRIYY
jgi:hypothetical protein